MPTPSSAPREAAVLVDYQNLYYYLKGHLKGSTSPGDAAAELIGGLRDHLAAEGCRIAGGYAYADFAGLDDHVRHVQRALYLHGIQPFFVPGTVNRNTTDLQLAVDALRLRDDIPRLDTFVFVSGDRDYVPVVQALQRRGKRVLMVSFRDHLSGHLLDNAQAGEYLSAEALLPESLQGAVETEEPASEPGEPVAFNAVQELPNDRDYDALEIIEEFFGQYREVYLTPLLRRLSDELAEFADADPKTLVGELEDCGAVRLERRRGMPYDYTVLIVNEEHPAVIEVRAELAEENRLPSRDEADDENEPTGELFEDFDESEA